MTFELFDTDTGNIIGTFASQHEALRVLKSVVDAYGVSYAEPIVLGTRNEDGQPRAIAEGEKLLALVMRTGGADRKHGAC